jgi:nucleoside 2-deoxyribosyltransferase
MKIYVAGSTKQMEAVRGISRVVKDLGNEITFDWTERVEQLGDAHVNPVPHEARREGAYLDREGIKEADGLIVWLTPECLGTLIEIGMACVWEIPTLLLCPHALEDSEAIRTSIFYDMDHITWESLNEGERMDIIINEWIEREL